MVDYKRILLLRSENVSQRGIAEVLGCSRNTVASVFAAAVAKGIVWEAVAGLDETEVRHLLLPEPTGREPGRVAPDFQLIHRELTRPGVTLLVLWNEYVSKTRTQGGVPYQYSFFNEQYRKWAHVNGATMTVPRSPGESVEVDWAGDPMGYLDPLTGAPCRGWLFVAALSYSAFGYVEACPDMSLDSWITAHVNAFDWFGGSARLLIPDNLRAGVSKPDRYEPVLNPAYEALAEHYGTAVIPARVRRPRDKPLAENSVRFLANTIAAILRDRFVGLAELNEAIRDEVTRINDRAFQKREGSRTAVFLVEEKPLLNPLPAFRFEMAELKKAKAGPNYHVEVGGCFYSVQSCLIGKTLDIRVTSRLVEVFDQGERIASHVKVVGAKGRYQTVAEHMPPAHRAQLKDWTPGRFTEWAQTIGPATRGVIEAILASRKIVEQSYRSCLGVMSLAKRQGGAARLEDACKQALTVTVQPSYTLVKRLWTTWEPVTPKVESLGDKGFVRGAGYYSDEENQS
jgi:transposase